MESTNSIDTQEHLEPIIYICAECGNDLAVQPTQTVRCRNCGTKPDENMTKLSDTVEQVERLKQLVEKFLATDDDNLLGMYEEYQQFKGMLNNLLSTVAKYRIQLQDTDEQKAIFGPKTRQIVEQLVRHYDKVYEVDEEQLVPRFLEVEQVNALLARQTQESEDEEADVDKISILEETKENLKKIEQAKLVQQTGQQRQIDLSNLQDGDSGVMDPFYCVQQVYKNDPAVVLEDILAEMHDHDTEMFLPVLGNVANLISQISKHPDNLTQRVLRLNNEKLYEDFIQYPKAVALLKYARFKLKHSDDIKEILIQLGLENMKDEYFLYLQEPDMFGDYRAWKEWIDFLGTTSHTLEDVITQYKSVLRRNRAAKRNTLEEALVLAGCRCPSKNEEKTLE
ncbi:DNA-directed RNA polymerase II RPABC4 [Babesia ovis]|uniref:DNA-directed RNA polymerase II RPABC4 n=1 Tax=Babesia ovis TaxID=5869 RepID=A0A9W5TA97_BABOV|nr:DNA-directed RNA polymerase II RPABC4 [Babesia ovis]